MSLSFYMLNATSHGRKWYSQLHLASLTCGNNQPANPVTCNIVLQRIDKETYRV
jgi:hypothetical protein